MLCGDSESRPFDLHQLSLDRSVAVAGIFAGDEHLEAPQVEELELMLLQEISLGLPQFLSLEDFQEEHLVEEVAQVAYLAEVA
jgi:hypothetical protein